MTPDQIEAGATYHGKTGKDRTAKRIFETRYLDGEPYMAVEYEVTMARGPSKARRLECGLAVFARWARERVE
jgi:hypothetical protein